MLMGLKLTTAFNSGLITSATPAVMTILSGLVLKEKIRTRQILSIIFAVTGIVFIQLISVKDREAGMSLMKTLGGNLLIFGAVVCEALLTIFRKKPSEKPDSITNTTIIVFISLILITPFFIAEKYCGKIHPVWNIQNAAVVLFYGCCATAMAYILWGDAALRLPASQVGIYTSLIPVTASFLSIIILREKIHYFHAAAALFVTASIIIGTRSIRPKKTEPPYIHQNEKRRH